MRNINRSCSGRLRPRFWAEATFAAAAAVLAVVTLLWRSWIETLFRVEPDRGSGTLEWLLVAVLVVVAVLTALAARAEFRRNARLIDG